MDKDFILLIARKESLLNELIVWLRAKGLYDEAMKACPSSLSSEAEGEKE